nr:GrdB-related putative oxidoreductase [Clostridium fallax]
MKIIMIYDQIQAGAGTKDDRMVPLSAKKEPLGPSIMMEPFLKKIDGKVIACLYCGNGTYLANPDEVSRKFCAMVNKVKPDIVICGPAFNYVDYGKMAARVAYDINRTTNVPAFAAMSSENEETINEYKDKLNIVITPKKGGVGLNDALDNMCQLAKLLVNKEDIRNLTNKVCFK